MLFRSGLIHMDGRVYDPAIGRFLSPDNYVQLPENSQSFNRYSYCINNPLKYTDPTGQFFQIGFIGAALLAADAFANAMTTDSGSKFFISSAISIFSPAVSGAIGGIFGHSVGSFGNELLRAGAHGLASGVMNALQGENFGAGFASGALASFAGSGAQWAGLGKGGVLGATTLFGGIGSASFGGDFLQGAMTGLSIGLYNHTWKEGGITYNDDNPNDITGLIDEVFVDNHLTLSPPTAPVEKGLELVFPEFEILTGVRALFNGAFNNTYNHICNRISQPSYFNNTQYSWHVEQPLIKPRPQEPFHSFPRSVDAFEKDGIRFLKKGGDGKIYEHLHIKGSYRGKDGVFEYIKDSNGNITHRFFRPQ